MLDYIKDRTRTQPIEKVFEEFSFLEGLKGEVKERVNRIIKENK